MRSAWELTRPQLNFNRMMQELLTYLSVINKVFLFRIELINAYDGVQEGFIQDLVNYTIYDALQNTLKAWSIISSQTISNCWNFEEFEDYDSIISDEYDIIIK